MTYPTITHINDVLPSVEGRKDFVVAHKDGYSVIDYVFAGDDTFDDPMRMECRGIKFAPDGSILARPLRKFFNIGQTPETQPHRIDFSLPHTIMEKLDGSMIHPAIVSDEVVFMTRMGRTDVARKAERHLKGRVAKYCRMAAENGLTPIFEWTAPDNRIVVRYDDDSLTLLACRRNDTGEYFPSQWCAAFAADMRIPIATHFPTEWRTASDFLAYARAIQDAEGFVVKFDNGLWVKAKGDDYVLKHKAKDSILQEKNILALVLSGGLDDVLPLLDTPDAEAASAYAASVEAGVRATASAVEAIVAQGASMTQKDFALGVALKLDGPMRTLAFQVRAGQSPTECIRARIAANCNSSSGVEECRSLHNATWRLS